MNLSDLTDLPPWIKTVVTLIAGAGSAKLLAVWLESRRLERKEYRETLLTRIKQLEHNIDEMHQKFTELHVQLALVRDENQELKERLKGGKDGLDQHSS